MKKGTVHSPEARSKMSNSAKARTNRPPMSEENKKKTSLMHKGHNLTPEHIEKLRASHTGKVMPQEIRAKISKANKGKKKPPRSVEHTKKISAANKGRIQSALEIEKRANSLRGKYTGDKASGWRGGVTSEYRIVRSSSTYRIWRKAVFERDHFTCQLCNVRGGYLEADHIKPFAFFVSLRFKVSNGRTLCKKCHKKTDTYGRKAQHYYARVMSLKV